MNTSSPSSRSAGSAVPFQFILTTQWPADFSQANSTAQNSKSSAPSFCPLWDAGAWQLSLAHSKQSRLSPEKELSLFAHALQLNIQSSQNTRPFGIVVTTPAQVEAAASVATHFFIPGEFCRQGDVLAAASKSGATVLIERGAFLAPNDVMRALEKLDSQKILLVDAGTSFGYSDRVLDVRALAVLKATGLPFGVNLSALCGPQGQVSVWKGQWLSESGNQEKFVNAFVDASLALGASFFVYRNEEIHVRRKLERTNL